MSNYTKVTNFTAKDSLPPGNSNKVVRGSEIDTEFTNVATAIATKTDNNAANITGGTITGITDLAVADGGTGASTASGARTNLGLVIGTDVQAYDAQLADIAGLTPTDNNFIVGNGTNFVAESGSTARTSLGLGSIATQDSSNVTITGGSVTGITDITVADGGTGASTAASARVNLLPSYTGNAGKVLAVASGAADVEWITVSGGGGTGDVTGPSSSTDNTVPRFDGSTGKIIQTSGVTINDANEFTVGAWKATEIAVAYGGTGASTLTGIVKGNGTSAFTAATAGTDYLAPAAIGTTVQAYDADTAKYDDATANFTGTLQKSGSNVLVASNIGSTVQAYDAQLADVAGLTPTDNGVIIGNGTNFVVESGATLKTSLGLTIGTDVQAYDSNLTSFVNTFTLPTTDGTNGQVLQTNGSGTISFATPSSGGVTTGKAIAMALIFGF